MAFQAIVKDFLAAKDVRLTVKGLTILKGESSTGKSSFIKGVYASLTNSFSPSQVRWGAPQSEVHMLFDQGAPRIEVIRKRTGSPIMRFRGQEYSKIGRDVPQEIEEYTNIGFLQVGQEKYCLNFFSQFQPPLLHTFTQRRIAEILSSSNALDDFNLVTKGLNTKRDELSGSFKSLDSLLSETTENLSEVENFLDKNGSDVNVLEKLYMDWKTESKKSENLLKIKDDLSKKSIATSRGAEIRGILDIFYDVEADSKNLKDLERLASDLKQLKKTKESNSEFVNVLESIINYEHESFILNSLITLLGDIDNLDVLTKDSDRIFLSLNEENCPLCGSKLE